MSGKNSIQVAIKVRPLLRKEKDQLSLWRVVENSIQQTDSQTDPYYFDHIFDQEASNQIIFEKMAKHIVHAAIQGFNGTIFAYGQTSSGKTYTMMGDDDNPGVMVLAAKDIFREIELATDRQFLLRVGYIEIYNEKIYDLLNKNNQDLKIHETSSGIITVNCEESIITCEEDLLHHLTEGSKVRTVGETNMNERSSRSHAIFRIIIESRKMDRSDDDSIIQSVLNLVDLAGSERADQTGARGTRLKEGGHINKSLLFLSNVIKRLSENEDHKYISYRDSKLTRILQASLGGNALTAIICTIKPTAIEETQSTLSFALRAKSIKNKPQVNETVSDATMMKRLEREIKQLRSRLEEEQRRNESQIKVRQLEQRIRDEDLKIISCNSLHSVRNREKRRRTWCPSSTNLDTSSVHMPSALPVPSFLIPPANTGLPLPSRLQAPKSFYHTPLITMRPTEPPPAPKTSTCSLPLSVEHIPEIDEEFAPAELVNFDRLSPIQTPKAKSIPRFSTTPKVIGNPKLTLELVELDLSELKCFTNLENQIGVQYETDLALQQKVDALTHRNTVLENERMEYILLKDEVNLTRDKLSENEKRYDELQIHVSKLTKSNKIANEKIAKYEQELAELKKINEKLEMENRDAVNIEFEFDRHKNKSKLRENELIEVLTEKDKEIVKLEKSLKSIGDEKLQNTKEELLQLSLTETDVDENGKVCVKCEDLQRLLAENEKVTQEFAKLTLEYEQLRLNYQEIEKENEQSKLKINELEELQKTERAECEKLQKDLQALKGKLQRIQSEYEQVNLENSSKTEECMALNYQVESARKDMVVLQEKYNKLELSWQEQQQTLKDIESQYAEIEIKYKHLQSEYEQLESCKGQSVTDCERLQKENVELQTEIVELKHKVQDVKQQLLENAEQVQENISAASAKESETANVQKENEELKQQLSEIQTQFEELQKEYDDLSNQLMDNLQESDTLKQQNTDLEERLKAFEEKNVEVTRAEAEICELKSQLERVLTSDKKFPLNTPSPCRNSSMRSSGVCIDEEEFEDSPGSEDLLKKFCQLSESLTQIELEHHNGKRRVFKTPTTTTQTPNYKLYLRNIMGVSKIQKDFNEEMENIHLQGTFKQHSFHIVELSSENGVDTEMQCDDIETNGHGCVNCSGIIAKLAERIEKLKNLNEEERHANKSLLENTERNLSEMREQITQLSAELLEKSIFVENCACKTYQRQIETLEKEKADITLVFEELQEKVNNCTFDGSLMNFTMNGEIKPPSDDLKKDLEELLSKERELLDTLDSQTKMLEELTQRNLDLESDLKTAQEQLDEQENEYKQKCNQLQLEILEKLEISASEHRDNMKKYNKEWEDRRVDYENTIKEFENQIEILKTENEDTSVNARQVQEQLDQVKQEFNQLQSEHLELQQSVQNQKETEEISSETSKELEQLKQNCDTLQAQRLQQCKEHEEVLKAIDLLKERETQLLKEKEEVDTNLLSLREDFKKLNEQYNHLVQEKNTFSEENESLHNQLSALEEKLKNNEELQEHMGKLKEEKEQLNLERKQIQQKLQDAEQQIQEYCTEDSAREEMIKALQAKVVSLEVLEIDTENLNKNLEQVQSEKSELNSRLEMLTGEKQVLEKRISELTESDEAQQKLSEIQLETLRQEKQVLEDQVKQYEMLQEQKALLVDQLQTLESIVEEKKSLEEKLREHDSLQQANQNLEEQMKILQEQQKLSETEIETLKQEKESLEDNLKQYETLQEEKDLLEAQLQTLKSIVEEKKALEDKLGEHDTLHQAKQALEEQLKALHGVVEEKADLEAKLQQISDIQQEQLKSLENANEEKQSLKEKLKEFEVVKQERYAVEELFKEKVNMLEVLQQELKSLEEQLQKEGEDNERQRTEISALNEKVSVQYEELQRTVSIVDNYKEREATNLKETESLKEAITTLTNSSSILELEKCNVEKQLQQCNAELQQLSNEHETLKNQLTQLTEEKKSLSEQCSQLAEDKSTLEEQLKCLKGKEKAEEMLEEMIKEKSEISHNLRLANEKLENKQQELETLQQENEKLKHNVQLLKCSLTNFNKETQKLEEELVQYKQLSEEKSQLEATITDLKNAQSEALSVLKKENASLQLTIAKYDHTISQHTQKEETLTQKVETLSQQLHEMRTKAKAYEDLLQQHDEVERSLHAATKQNEELSNEIRNLQSSIDTTTQTYEVTVQTQCADIKNLNSQLLETKEVVKELRSKLSEIQDDLQSQQSTLQRQAQELQGSLAELQLKHDSLQATNTQLQTLNQQLEQQLQQATKQLQQSQSVQDELSAIKAEYAALQKKMEATVDEAGRCSRSLREDLEHHKQLLEKQSEIYNDLRKDMITKESSFDEEREQLTNTIATLQSTNTNLEEKIREITVNNFKQDLQKQTTDVSANTSVDANTSFSPRPRKSLESMNISIEDKLCANLQKGSLQTNERKNRRLSTFDERRRQSYWGATHDKQTMTDRVDTSCNCEELDRKLKACERNLFIRESQVTALSMELKNHPLKDENAVLMKRLQEEQDKNRIELKRYKQKIYEQTVRAEKALAAVVHAENKSTTVALTVGAAAAPTPTHSSVLVHAETQTDCDLSASLSKLQGKYKDLVNICRHRMTVIKELEERVAHKENADGNSMTPLEMGQMRTLKSQCDSMKKELDVIKEKYTNAKLVLHTRREEIQRLRSQLEQS